MDEVGEGRVLLNGGKVEEGGEEEGGCGLGRAESSGWRRVRGGGH